MITALVIEPIDLEPVIRLVDIEKQEEFPGKAQRKVFMGFELTRRRLRREQTILSQRRKQKAFLGGALYVVLGVHISLP